MSQRLAGWHVAITREPRDGEALALALRAAGASPLLLPAIEVVPPTTWEPLDTALRELATFDWAVVTSANGVRALQRRCAALGVAPLAQLHTATVGAATAKALVAAGWPAPLMPAEAHAEGLLAALPPLAGQHVLLPQSARARPVLREGLAAAGALVTAPAAYDVAPGAGLDALAEGLADGSLDAAVFASPSAVEFTLATLAARGRGPAQVRARCVAIGPITAARLTAAGLGPATVADSPYPDAIIAALVRCAELDHG